MAKDKKMEQWEADDDARTLMSANKIRRDAKRLKRAQKSLARLEQEAEQTKLEVRVAKKLKKLGEE